MKAFDPKMEKDRLAGFEKDNSPARYANSAAVLVLATIALVVGIVGFVVAIFSLMDLAAIRYSEKGK